MTIVASLVVAAALGRLGEDALSSTTGSGEDVEGPSNGSAFAHSTIPIHFADVVRATGATEMPYIVENAQRLLKMPTTTEDCPQGDPPPWAVNLAQQVRQKRKPREGASAAFDFNVGKLEDPDGLRTGTSLIKALYPMLEAKEDLDGTRLRMLGMFLMKSCAEATEPLDKRSIDFIRTFLVYPIEAIFTPRRNTAFKAANVIRAPLSWYWAVRSRMVSSKDGREGLLAQLIDVGFRNADLFKLLKDTFGCDSASKPALLECVALEVAALLADGHGKQIFTEWFDKACAVWPGDPSLYLSRATYLDDDQTRPRPYAHLDTRRTGGRNNPVKQVADDVWKVAAMRLEPTDLPRRGSSISEIFDALPPRESEAILQLALVARRNRGDKVDWEQQISGALGHPLYAGSGEGQAVREHLDVLKGASHRTPDQLPSRCVALRCLSQRDDVLRVASARVA